MKNSNVKLILLMYVLIGSMLIPSITEAKNKPLIDRPLITEKNHKVTLQWNQTESVLVTVYKLSYTRKLSDNCKDVETLGASCVMLWQRTGLTGSINVVDKGYKKGDQYFIQQNVYQSHNSGYGPFMPR